MLFDRRDCFENHQVIYILILISGLSYLDNVTTVTVTADELSVLLYSYMQNRFFIPRKFHMVQFMLLLSLNYQKIKRKTGSKVPSHVSAISC